MPPRLQLLPFRALTSATPITAAAASTTANPLAFLLAGFQQSRNAHILASLSDNAGAYNKRIRRGRGPASGKGKTSGRGHKGQKQHGKVPAGFNGGQTPDIVVHGERGYNNIHAIELAPINLNRIQDWIDQGRIDPARPITIRELFDSRCIHQTKEGVKLLGRGVLKDEKGAVIAPSSSTTTTTTTASPSTSTTPESPSTSEDTTINVLKQPIHIVVSRASAAAIAAVEAAGGTVTTRFYTPRAIRRILKREMHPFVSTAWTARSAPAGLLAAEGLDSDAAGQLVESEIMRAMGFTYRLPDPTKRRDIEYYRDPAHRGYLSHLLKPMEGPSLFFRSPVERKTAAGAHKEKVLPENRLW
ncbi:mitochondrial 54S ribosomal protein uL15m [Aspergillus brunneoviolaceus CBS 621.78]|uniref:50S ribosomal subunit protein L15 n=1 Tax=Aspergillus brunneoviolaceus CBS 621.78 TaxID=1450534 RepID=A0ACD1GGK7_9EURO|nr:50S ribosomal subunit protein L15 [Aspergillus brunneoviolaceus CBS 621.78]RAH48288.1 50S ribosomal subunit protein L15 [Aspergillus brunneoviolaceus CBS 621.78]